MRVRTKGTPSGRLGKAKAKLARWRAGCRGPGRIPADLWRLAAEAAAESGIEETARQLDLNPERLGKRVEELGLGAAPAAMEFVELPPLPFGTPGECLVRVDDPSGRKIQVSLKGPGRHAAHDGAFDAVREGNHAMIQTGPTLRILVATQPVDFRNGIDGLAATCRKQLEQDPMTGCAFVFRNRKGTAIKILLYDGQGYWLCCQ